MIERFFSLFQRTQFDADACIKLLQDRKQSAHERDAAAESLLYFEDREAAIDALVKAIRDSDDDECIRMSSASTLGAIFNEVGIDKQILETFETPYRSEVLAEISP